MPRNALLLLSRLLLAALFVPSGFHALADIAGTSGYFAGLGLPLPTLVAWATGLFELIAGLLILVGFKHSQMLMKDIAISGGFLALAMAGAGAWSADGRVVAGRA
ncbi:MAG: DoxX family protein [Mesorhizobium sp.]|uniref:DoxX family protein n=1 Tax=Mesorhizobium sp. TaxID=1871066 RepID=UPI00121FE5A7|nr:DoxX family protein [Mesorhizobium sp.]TIT17802.1 MAG: DoxX family protein [Mesorhizobium sp.]